MLQTFTNYEAGRTIRALIAQFGPESVADWAAEACETQSIAAQENNKLDACAELQRAGHHFAEASACMCRDNGDAWLAAAAAAKPSADDMSAALKENGFFVGGLSDEAITHHYGAMLDKAAAAAKN